MRSAHSSNRIEIPPAESHFRLAPIAQHHIIVGRMHFGLGCPSPKSSSAPSTCSTSRTNRSIDVNRRSRGRICRVWPAMPLWNNFVTLCSRANGPAILVAYVLFTIYILHSFRHFVSPSSLIVLSF